MTELASGLLPPRHAFMVDPILAPQKKQLISTSRRTRSGRASAKSHESTDFSFQKLGFCSSDSCNSRPGFMIVA